MEQTFLRKLEIALTGKSQPAFKCAKVIYTTNAVSDYFYVLWLQFWRDGEISWIMQY